MGTRAYDKKNTFRIGLKLNNKTDADILEWLQKQESMQGSIKSLIREDIRKNTVYRIKPEFIDLWGDDANPNATMTADEIADIARGWDMTFDEIIDQLEPIK